MGGFDTFRRFGHQGQADAAGAGVHTMGLARQQAARQHGDIVLSQQIEGEGDVVTAMQMADKVISL